MTRPPLCTVLMAFVVACSEAPAPAGAPPSSGAAESDPVTVDSTVQPDRSPSSAPSEAGRNAESVYTDLDLGTCTTLRTFPESGDRELRCPGHAEIPLFVTEGDLRYDVDAGVPNNRWTSPSEFNSLGERVEWRIRDGQPFAAILRYDIEGGDRQRDRSDLAVLKVGREDSPGCLVGWVAAEALPSQNAAARALADADAADFDCAEAP